MATPALSTANKKVVPINLGTAKTSVVKESAFLRAVGTVDSISPEGEISFLFKPGKLSAVAEGELKPLAQGSFESIEAYAYKLANKQLFTDEVIENEEGLLETIYDAVLANVGNDIDEITATTGTAVTDGFGSVQTLPATSAGEVIAAITTLQGTSGARPTGIVASVAAYGALYTLSLGVSGRNPLETITGDPENPGSILGIPVFVFDGQNPNDLFIGDFKNRARAGIVRGYPKVILETSAVTLQGEGATTYVRTLADHNEVALIPEVRFAFKVANLGYFARLETTPEVVEEG